jgi:hypothetical protein
VLKANQQEEEAACKRLAEASADAREAGKQFEHVTKKLQLSQVVLTNHKGMVRSLAAMLISRAERCLSSGPFVCVTAHVYGCVWLGVCRCIFWCCLIFSGATPCCKFPSALQVEALEKSQQDIDHVLKNIHSDLFGTDLDQNDGSDRKKCDDASTGSQEGADPAAAGGNNCHSDTATGSNSNCTKPPGPGIKRQRKRRRVNLGKQVVLDIGCSEDLDLQAPGGAGIAGTCLEQYDSLMAGLAAAKGRFNSDMATWQAQLDALDHHSIKQDVQARAELKLLENEVQELHRCINMLQAKQCVPERIFFPFVAVQMCPTRTNHWHTPTHTCALGCLCALWRAWSITTQNTWQNAQLPHIMALHVACRSNSHRHQVWLVVQR